MYVLPESHQRSVAVGDRSTENYRISTLSRDQTLKISPSLLPLNERDDYLYILL